MINKDFDIEMKYIVFLLNILSVLLKKITKIFGSKI